MGRTEERISGLEERTMENAPTWTAERKRGTKGPAEPHGPVTLRWRSTSGIAREETEGRAGRNDAETPPRGGGHAPWAPRSHGRGPRHRGAGASAGSASLRRLVLLATCLRSVYGRSALGATEDTAQPGRWRPCSQHGLLGTLSPSLRPAAQKKIPFKTCLPLDRAPGPARAPRLREAVRDTHGRLRRRPMRDTAGPAPAVGAAGIASRAWAPRAGLQHGGHTTAALPGTPGHPSSPVRLAARRRPERNRRVAPAPGTARAPRRTNTGSWTPRPAAARLPQRTWKYSLESTGGRAGASPTAERRLQRQPHQKLPFGLFRIFCGLTRILVFQNICTYINKATGISTEIALNFNNINVLDP